MFYDITCIMFKYYDSCKGFRNVVHIEKNGKYGCVRIDIDSSWLMIFCRLNGVLSSKSVTFKHSGVVVK